MDLTRRRLRSVFGFGARRSSLRTYLVGVILISTVPIALLLSVQVFEGIRGQHRRVVTDLERSSAVLARGVERELVISAGARRPAPSAPEPAAPRRDTAAADDVALARTWIEAGVWQRLQDASAVPPTGFAMLFDDAERLVASGAAAAGSTTPPLTAAMLASLRQRPAGSDRVASPDGTEVLMAWHRIEPGGWMAAVALPAAPLDAAERRAFIVAFSTAGACMLLGLSLGLLLARRLIQRLDALASVGQVGALRPSPILEVERLRERLLSAQIEGDAAIARLEAKATEFQTLFDSSPVGLSFAQDRECRVVLHNPAMRALFGPLPGSRSAPAKVLHDGRPMALDEQPLQRAAASGEPVEAMEVHIDSGDGRPTVVLTHAVPLYDADGRPRGAISAAVDITRRKEDERRLLQADDRLRENQHLIDLAQDAGQVGFFSHDFDRSRLAWSPGQARLFGFPAEGGSAAVGPDDWLPRIDAVQRVHIEALMRQMLLLGQDKETFDYRLSLPDGEPRWMSSRVLVRYHADGTPRQMIGVTVDVSRHKKLELERTELIEQEQSARRLAEAANQAKDEFLAMLGHELRNPLGAVSTAVEVLRRVDRDGPMAATALDIMVRQTANLARIMDDLLDVAGVISGKVVLSRLPIDLGALAQRAAATLRLGSTGAHQRVVDDVRPVWVDADPTRVEQVVMNLLGNALKHTPGGSAIELTVAREGDSAVLRVRDHGPGIPPALVERMFDLFVQGERPLDRRGGGLGMGLTLVRRLVTLHGGTVTAESTDRGSVFEVCLPAVEAPPSSADRAEPDQAPKVASRSVVLVEDNPDAALALRSHLELDGHAVHSVDNGLTGLDAIVAQRPDVAIVDLGLPGLTGFEVALKSRAAGYPGLMIATSGYGQWADTQRTRQAGFDAHLVKPVDASKLRELMADRA